MVDGVGTGEVVPHPGKEMGAQPLRDSWLPDGHAPTLAKPRPRNSHLSDDHCGVATRPPGPWRLDQRLRAVQLVVLLRLIVPRVLCCQLAAGAEAAEVVAAAPLDSDDPDVEDDAAADEVDSDADDEEDASDDPGVLALLLERESVA